MEIGQPVGELLDWSSPELLKALGLPIEQLVSTSVATWKRHVTPKRAAKLSLYGFVG
jgi:hypothetical protein